MIIDGEDFYLDLLFFHRSKDWSPYAENWQIQPPQKLYERSQIANAQLPIEGNDVHHSFKDPYFLDFLALKEARERMAKKRLE